MDERMGDRASRGRTAGLVSLGGRKTGDRHRKGTDAFPASPPAAMRRHQRIGILLVVVCILLRACRTSRAIELTFDNQLVIVANGKPADR